MVEKLWKLQLTLVISMSIFASILSAMYSYFEKIALMSGEIDPISFHLFLIWLVAISVTLANIVFSIVNERKEFIKGLEKVSFENLLKAKVSFKKVYFTNLFILHPLVWAQMITFLMAISYIYKGYLSLVYIVTSGVAYITLILSRPLFFQENIRKYYGSVTKWFRKHWICWLGLLVCMTGVAFISF